MIKLPFDLRWVVVLLTAAGFLMCTFGAIGLFVTKAPAHPLTIAGYILGAAALFTGIVQAFRLQFPYLSNPRTALVLVALVIIIKYIIARLSFLLPVK